MLENSDSGDVTVTESSDEGINSEDIQRYMDSRGEVLPGDKTEAKQETTKKTATERARDATGKFAKSADETAKASTDNATDKDLSETDEKSTNNAEKGQKTAEEERNYKGMAHEERQKRQELQAKIDKFEAALANIQREKQQEQLQKFYQQQQAQVPQFDENPLENLRLTQAQLNEQIRAQNEYLQKQYQVQQYTAQEQKFKEDYLRDLMAYKQEKPDIENAYNFMAEKKLQEFMGMGLSKEEAQQVLIDNERLMIIKARQAGVNPADRVYKLAQSLGYSNQPPAEAAPQLNQEIAQKLDNIERGIKASRSISNAGSAPTQTLSFEQLAALDGDELKAWVRKDDNWKKFAQMSR